MRTSLALALLLVAAPSCVATQRQRTVAEKAASRMGWHITLWEHTLLADDIVLADVGPTQEENRLFEAQWVTTSLAVVESWKGRREISSVGRSGAYLCGTEYKPSQPREGSRAIVFIRRSGGENELLAARHPSSAEEVAQYRAVISAAVARQAAGKENDRDWMMLAARTRATRWDGLAAIVASRVPMTPAELESVAAAYLLEPSVDAAIELTMGSLAGSSLEGLDDAFASSIDAAISSKHSWSRAVRLIDRLVAHRNCSVARRLYDPKDPGSPDSRMFTKDGWIPIENRTGVLAWWQEVKRECGLNPHPIAGVGKWSAPKLRNRPE